MKIGEQTDLVLYIIPSIDGTSNMDKQLHDKLDLMIQGQFDSEKKVTIARNLIGRGDFVRLSTGWVAEILDGNHKDEMRKCRIFLGEEIDEGNVRHSHMRHVWRGDAWRRIVEPAESMLPDGKEAKLDRKHRVRATAE